MYKFPLLSYIYTYMCVYVCVYIYIFYILFVQLRPQTRFQYCICFLKWQPTPVFLPRKFHGQRSLIGYSSWGSQESDTTEWWTQDIQMNSFLSLYCYLFMKEFPMCWILLIAFLWWCLTSFVIPFWPDSGLNFCKEAIKVVFVFHGIIWHLLCLFLEYLDCSLDLHTYY